MTVLGRKTFVYFPLEFLDRVKRATDDDTLVTALNHDVETAQKRWEFQLLDRPHHDDARRLLRIRKLYDEYKEICQEHEREQRASAS